MWNFQAGEVLLIDKPLNWTSFQVVNKVRWNISRKLGVKRIKVGHCGTLDPLATGLLILCTGKKTKIITSFQDLPKAYTGTFKMGATTPCYDAEQEEDAQYPIDHLTEEMIRDKTAAFTGKIEQFPPIFSAVKVGGKTSYKAARSGEALDIKARQVEITKFDIPKIELPFVDFEVHCSKGTYIRSLANDFGKSLGSGAYLTGLRRTLIGDYSVDKAWQLTDLIEKIEQTELIKEV